VGHVIYNPSVTLTPSLGAFAEYLE
jgi:hypothetical protein